MAQINFEKLHLKKYIFFLFSLKFHILVPQTEKCQKKNMMYDLSFLYIKCFSQVKYVGVSIEDLVEIYCLFICSTAEYCSAVCATSLTVKQERKLSNIEKTALTIIIQDNYISYEAALEMTGLSSLSDRRAAHLLSFSRRASRHPVHGPRMFPLNPDIQDIHNLRTREKFHVNF